MRIVIVRYSLLRSDTEGVTVRGGYWIFYAFRAINRIAEQFAIRLRPIRNRLVVRRFKACKRETVPAVHFVCSVQNISNAFARALFRNIELRSAVHKRHNRRLVYRAVFVPACFQNFVCGSIDGNVFRRSVICRNSDKQNVTETCAASHAFAD